MLAILASLGHEAGLTAALKRRLTDLGLGLSNRDIAAKHEITVNTVKTEIKALYRALDLDCRHEISRTVRRALLRLERGMRPGDVEAIMRLDLVRLRPPTADGPW